MSAVRNPRYDNLQVYKIDLNKLQRGDVILTRNVEGKELKGKVQSDAIALKTGGDFSHALLCTAVPTLIEAIGNLVSNISAQRCFVHDLKHIQIRRYHDVAIADAAASAALLSFSKSYDLWAAIRSAFPGKLSSTRNDRTFCSALVAAAFRAAGADEFIDIDPMKTTPAHLQKMTCFADVTGDVCVKIKSPKNIEDMSALDGDRTVSPMAEQGAIMNSYYMKLAKPIDELITDHPTLTDHRPNSFFECVIFISGLSAAVERFPEGPFKAAMRERSEALDILGFELLSEGRLEALVEAAAALDAKSIRGMIDESFKSDPDIVLEDLCGMIHATKKQIASRSSILGDRTKPPGQSRMWDEWVRLTILTVNYFEARLKAFEESLARTFPAAARELANYRLPNAGFLL